MRLLSPASISIAPCANARLLPCGTTTRWPPNEPNSCAAMGSWMKSESPMRMTTLSAVDSFNPCSTGGSGFFSSFFSSSDFGGSTGFGFPFGNAVLNLPSSRSASVCSLPDAAKFFLSCSPPICADIGSTSCEFFDDLMSTVCFSPSTGVPLNEPASASNMLFMPLVSTSSLFTAFSVSESTAGFGPCPVCEM